MIEIEKKFQPNEEQVRKILENAEPLGTYTNQDDYFDYDNYKLLKQNIKLRTRNGSWELKRSSRFGEDEEEDEEKIIEFLRVQTGLNFKSMEEFLKDSFSKAFGYEVKRKKYKIDGLILDHDSCDFGFELWEVEALAQNEEEIKLAKKKIKEFKKTYGIEFKEISKRKEYLCRHKPDIYQEIFGNKIKEINLK